jgi:hypothetical protein
MDDLWKPDERVRSQIAAGERKEKKWREQRAEQLDAERARRAENRRAVDEH